MTLLLTLGIVPEEDLIGKQIPNCTAELNTPSDHRVHHKCHYFFSYYQKCPREQLLAFHTRDTPHMSRCLLFSLCLAHTTYIWIYKRLAFVCAAIPPSNENSQLPISLEEIPAKTTWLFKPSLTKLLPFRATTFLHASFASLIQN